MPKAFSSSRIIRVRKRLGENQTEFARRLGVSQPTLCRWETEGLPREGAARLVEWALRQIETTGFSLAGGARGR
jgi:DNA-binding transcriptional regulator YiaG